MARHFDGEYSRYPDVSYEALVNCLTKFDETVLEAQNANWQFFYDSYISDRSNWSNTDINLTWLETRQNKSALFGGYPDSLGTYNIAEPCNYVSNAAYYM